MASVLHLTPVITEVTNACNVSRTLIFAAVVTQNPETVPKGNGGMVGKTVLKGEGTMSKRRHSEEKIVGVLEEVVNTQANASDDEQKKRSGQDKQKSRRVA
jgi:hypothetical protein